VARKRRAGGIDLALAQRRQDRAVIVIGSGFPIRSPGDEEKTRARGMQIVDRREQARHRARPQNQTMEPSVRRFKRTYVTGAVARFRRSLGFVQNGISATSLTSERSKAATLTPLRGSLTASP
jgi:hypothetical protein